MFARWTRVIKYPVAEVHSSNSMEIISGDRMECDDKHRYFLLRRVGMEPVESSLDHS